MSLSKTQIDKLGNRLKEGSHTESDLRLLDEYRRSFSEACEAVVQIIRERGEFPTKRPEKTFGSITEKLRRESIRLSQMQDIAGCRIVVANMVEQERLVAVLSEDFLGASVIDRREKPSHGYRAVHVIVEKFGKPIEIQVRSALQHLWAEFSEKLSDVLGSAIKYGGGNDVCRNFLKESSETMAVYEGFEKIYFEVVSIMEAVNLAPEETKKAVEEPRQLTEQYAEELRRRLDYAKTVYTNLFTCVISQLGELKRQNL